MLHNNLLIIMTKKIGMMLRFCNNHYNPFFEYYQPVPFLNHLLNQIDVP